MNLPYPIPPSYVVKCWAGSSESDRTGYSPSNPARNTESYLAGCPASYGTSYSPENPASCSGIYGDGSSAGSSADCPDDRRERNLESNRKSNGADYSESHSVASLPDCLVSYPESFNP